VRAVLAFGVPSAGEFGHVSMMPPM
jgi:hypothetical protein